MLNAIGNLGSRTLAVWLVFLLSAIVIRVFFFLSPDHVPSYAGLLGEFSLAVLVYVAAAYGLREATNAYERTEEKRIRATNPRLPPSPDDVQGAG